LIQQEDYPLWAQGGNTVRFVNYLHSFRPDCTRKAPYGLTAAEFTYNYQNNWFGS